MTAIEKEIEIKKIVKRMVAITQELEVAALDIRINSVSLSKDSFPTQYFKETDKAFDSYATEMSRISEAWKRLFKVEIDTVEMPPEKKKK